MSETKTSTPKEIPLHEVVLAIMYEANKERPAQLTIEEVYAQITDDTISEIRIFDVLKWLVAQKEIEHASGKYSLDRFSFLDERKKDFAKSGKQSTVKDDTPLHELVLNAMFEASKDAPAKLSSDDIFWKISDPKMLRNHLSDVLQWLLNQRRIEYLGGKYSLDGIEFGTKKKAEEKLKVKKPVKKKKTVKDKAKETPKIVIPSAPEVEKVEPKELKAKIVPEAQVEKKPVKKVPKKTVEAPKEEPKPEIAKPAAPKKAPEKKIPEEKIEITEQIQIVKPKWRKPALIAAITCLVLIIVLLFVLVGSLPSGESAVSDGVIFGLFGLSSLALIIVAFLFYRQE